MDDISKRKGGWEVDTTKLKKGQVYKNYKEICLAMDDKVKTGAAKISQIEHWKSYFEFSRDGYKFVIEKVYKKPKGTMSRYGFINDLEELILDLLVQDENKGEVFLPKSAMFRILNMTNDNYNFSRYHIPKLSIYVNINEEEIREFYNFSNSALTRSVENALTRLRNKSLVYWSTAMTFCQVDSNIPINESGNIKINKIVQSYDDYGDPIYSFDVNGHIRYRHRAATKEETKKVLQMEREILDELDCRSKQEVIKRGKWKEFNSRIKEMIFDRMNILYYYDSYSIICNEEHIYKIWTELKDLSLDELNRDLKSCNSNENAKHLILNNALKRKEKAIADDESRHDYRKSFKYERNSNKLTKILIDQKAPIIKSEITKIKINVDT